MKINSFNISTSSMPNTVVNRKFRVNGEIGAKFRVIAIQVSTLKFYNFISKTFESGHTLQSDDTVTLESTQYTNSIIFPAGGDDYVIKLIMFDGTERINSKAKVISKNISKQAALTELTFTPGTLTTSAGYATLPTSTVSGSITSTSKTLSFNWDITNATTDSNSFGFLLNNPVGDIKQIGTKSFYFETTDTVDGAVTSGTQITLDDLTDIAVGMQIVKVSSGSLSGTPRISSIDTIKKIITISSAQTFADGITLTFRAYGRENIKTAIGLDFDIERYPALTFSELTHVVRADSDGDFTPSTTITLTDTHGIAGGNNTLVSYTGFGVDNSGNNRITSVTPDAGGGDGDGAMVVQSAQTLKKGTVLYFDGCVKAINLAGNINIYSFPTSDKTIYLDLEHFITLGSAS